MDLSDLNEEEDRLGYWNNWLPSSSETLRDDETGDSRQRQASKKIAKEVFKSSKTTTLISFAENPKFGNWIPPVQFLDADLRRIEKKFPKSVRIQIPEETVLSKSKEGIKKTPEVSEIRNKYFRSIGWKKEVNLDWGRRTELHDATKLNDSDIVWGVVNLGVFANIKLWINDYGNICGLAEGKISKLYSSEITFICIKNTQLLRKMLGLDGAQWASICETLQETKTALSFDAFQDTELRKKSNLEKLWIFICKRRHFLPDQCMQVKLCGAVKCMRKFQIIPKLVVQDIRNILGDPIP